jgi:hypothetical protein
MTGIQVQTGLNCFLKKNPKKRTCDDREVQEDCASLFSKGKTVHDNKTFTPDPCKLFFND